ncbi:MAG TPA: exodeoxyribonuclease VII large subunit [Nitratifractor sp.]|nr:exodeoxyribonuclease VII large subunit [Nitratifractor sp.]
MITVSELNEKIKAILETTFMHIVVEGEVSSVTYHTSGHLYFSVKDSKSTLKCVMWKGSVRKLKFTLEKGEHIVIEGSVGVYTPRGEYQFIATNIEPYGRGTLALAYEQLKKKLEAKGYFDRELKREIPKFPKRVAVVTALKSAAWQDVLKVATKRWPMTELVAIDVLVQGEAAAGEIAKAIAYADSLDVDTILITRGGGSQEDLWAFNEEVVADAIYRAKKPVVSAVGHEVDFLISDFVADLRAPTPSAAIETILPDRNEYLFVIDELFEKLGRAVDVKLLKAQEEAANLRERINTLSPMAKLQLRIAEFKSLKSTLVELMEHKLSVKGSAVTPLIQKLEELQQMQLSNKEQRLAILRQQILLNDPAKRVKSGFVEVVQNKKRAEICSLGVGESVELVNDKCKVEVTVITAPSTL